MDVFNEKEVQKFATKLWCLLSGKHTRQLSSKTKVVSATAKELQENSRHCIGLQKISL